MMIRTFAILFLSLVPAAAFAADPPPAISGALTINGVPAGWSQVAPTSNPSPNSIVVELANTDKGARVRIVATPMDVGNSRDYAKAVLKAMGENGISVHGDDSRAWLAWKCTETVTDANGNQVEQKEDNAWFFRRVTDKDGRPWLISIRGKWNKFGFTGEHITEMADHSTVNGSPEITGDKGNSNGDNFAPGKGESFYNNGNAFAKSANVVPAIPGDPVGIDANGVPPGASPTGERFRKISWAEKQ